MASNSLKFLAQWRLRLLELVGRDLMHADLASFLLSCCQASPHALHSGGEDQGGVSARARSPTVGPGATARDRRPPGT